MKFSVLVLISLCGFFANADVIHQDSSTYSDYFLIDENQTQPVQKFQGPQELLGQAQQFFSEIQSLSFNLLKFVHMQGQFGNTPEPYNRLQDFGSWIKDQSGQTCFNTRGVVLARDSSTAVGTSTSGCTVKTGSWQEPYTGRSESDANQLQIDHVVPLKNAYVSGAYQWDNKKRCLYANFLGNKFHLLAVDGHENMQKGDKGPEGYMPQDPNYTCQYLQHWVRIKMIWHLRLNPDEVKAIQNFVQSNHCDLNDYMYSAVDLQAQRQFIQQNMNLCSKN